MKLETIAIHGGYEPEPTTRAVAVPIYQTASYSFESTQHGADLFDLKVEGNIYTRIMNPTTSVLEQRVTALEGGIGALALASGMAAITYSILTLAEQGDNFVTTKSLYGGTYNLFAHTLPNYGIEARFCDSDDIKEMTNRVNQTADFYTRRFQDFMGYNSHDYPEYNQSTNGDMYPDQSYGFSSWVL